MENKMTYSTSKPLAIICVQIDVDKVDKNIDQIRKYENINLNLGELAIFSIIRSLKGFPKFNSNFDQNSALYPYVNLGHFINMGKGPRLAVIKNAETKSLFEISKEIKEAALNYMRESLEDETALSTITVTNLSSFEAFQVIPPVYENQSCTLSITSKFPVLNGQKFNLTLSYDARIADCQTAIAFLNLIKDKLENYKVKQEF